MVLYKPLRLRLYLDYTRHRLESPRMEKSDETLYSFVEILYLIKFNMEIILRNPALHDVIVLAYRLLA